MNLYCANEYLDNDVLEEVLLEERVPVSMLKLSMNFLHENCVAKHAFVVSTWLKRSFGFDSDSSNSVECGFAIACIESNKLIHYEFYGFFENYEQETFKAQRVEAPEEFLDKNEIEPLFNKLQKLKLRDSLDTF